MGKHILPQVLLRGFEINDPRKKDDSVIRVLTRNGVQQAKVKNIFQEDDFYSDQTEDKLNHSYENQFGIIKSIIRKFIEQNKVSFVELSIDKYRQLLKFFVVMWRRNDTQIEKMNNIQKTVFNSPFWRSKMKERYKIKSTEEIISENEKKLRYAFYDMAIKKTNTQDETVMKMFNQYFPVIIYNESEINFPLHNKYATVLQRKSTDEEYPDLSIQPIDNRIYILYFNKDKFMDTYNIRNQSRVKIGVRKISSENIIKALINMYIIYSVKSVVIDDSNTSIVRRRMYTDSIDNMIIQSKELEEIVNRCGLKSILDAH